MMNTRLFIIVAALNMFIAIGAGAFGAHGLKRILSEEMLAIWQTAVTYQMAHALGLFIVTILSYKLATPLLSWSAYLMLGGIVLFSGSLYILAVSGIRTLGAITPIGGVLFLAAWVCVVIAAIKTPNT
jgi:uncharacterized membrane protein YgdD (TMEM256/DUF423 family)